MILNKNNEETIPQMEIELKNMREVLHKTEEERSMLDHQLHNQRQLMDENIYALEREN